MGRRKGSSPAGTGILIVLGLLLAALGAVYQFIVENAAAIAVFGVVAGSLLLLAYFFSKIGRLKTAVASAPPALPRSATRLAPGPTTPQVEARDHFGFRQAPTAGPARGAARWVEPKESVTVQGIPISGGLFYVGVSIVVEDHEIDKYVINPKLAARSSSPDVTGTSMPYWPSYAEITPAARRAFLDWMSGGRQGATYGVGHVFLFFYGLEHRQFIDRDLASTPRMAALLCLFVVVEFTFDPLVGAVEEIDGRPQQVLEVGFEASFAQGSDECVEDVGDGTGDGTGFGKRSRVGLVLEGAIAVELELGKDVIGRGCRLRRLIVLLVVVDRHGGVLLSDRPRPSRPSWRRKVAGGPDLHRGAQRGGRSAAEDGGSRLFCFAM
jgi:hypothetical protein